jgi:hypothetical protein
VKTTLKKMESSSEEKAEDLSPERQALKLKYKAEYDQLVQGIGLTGKPKEGQVCNPKRVFPSFLKDLNEKPPKKSKFQTYVHISNLISEPFRYKFIGYDPERIDAFKKVNPTFSFRDDEGNELYSYIPIDWKTPEKYAKFDEAVKFEGHSYFYLHKDPKTNQINFLFLFEEK